MLVFNIELISQSMNKLHGMLVFFFLLAITYMVVHAPRELSAYNVQICKEFVLVFLQRKDGSNVHLSFLSIWLY